MPVLVLAPGVPARLAAAAAFLAGVLGSTNDWAHSLHSTDVPLPMALGISAGTAVTLTAAVLLFHALVLRGLPLLAAVAAPAVWTGILYLVALINPTFTTVVADLPAGPGATPYTRLGDWFAWLCLVIAVVGVIVVRRRLVQPMEGWPGRLRRGGMNDGGGACEHGS